MSGDSLGIGDAKSSSPPAMDHPPPLKYVFVSYASQNAAVANAVVEALENQGIRCWIAPRDVTPGEFYADAIVHAIDAAQALVLILSQHAAVSHHILREVERASSKRHPIISLRIDRAALLAGLEYFLNTSQWLDASEGQLSRAFPKLVEAVRRVVGDTAGTDDNNGENSPSSFSPAPARASNSSFNRPLVVVAGLMVVSVFAFLVDKWWSSGHNAQGKQVAALPAAEPVSAPAIPEKSVAVLPFVDMSEQKDQEYFSDGLSEELIDMLTKVPDLRVPARTSSFYFKGKQATISEIAKSLGVSHVLEGSIRKAGNRLRVTAQLIRTDNGYHEWSQTYNGNLDDIFKVQDEIAVAVVNALSLSLGVAAARAAPTGSAATYNLLLQAKFFLLRTTKEEQEKALIYYQQVIRSDPTSAEAWAGISRTTSNLVGFGVADWQESRNRALQAAMHAVTLNPDLCDAHIALGKVYMNLDQNFAAAKPELARALELEPHSAVALFWMAGAAKNAGDLSSSLMLYAQSIAADPLDGEAYFQMGDAQRFAGQFNEAESSYRRAVDLLPARPGLHSALGIVLLNQHKSDAAFEELAREPAIAIREAAFAWAYQFLGKSDESRTTLAEFETTRADTDAYSIAEIYALRNEPDRVFQWLNRAYRQHEYLMELKVEPGFNSIRSDPRFRALLRKMNLPE